ncbi:MAG: hypothetical protein AB1742_01345 [bacterium]
MSAQAGFLLNEIFAAVFAAALYPFRGFHPGAGLTAVSALSGAALLLVFKKTSNQGRIAEIRDRIRGLLLEIRIFRHDLGVVFRAQRGILLQTLVYMRYSLSPLAFIAPPVAVILIHLTPYYGYRPLMPGETAVISMKVDAGAALTAADVKLTVPDGLRVDAPFFRASDMGEIAWRLTVEAPGRYEVGISVGGAVLAKEVVAGAGVMKVSPVRRRGGFWSAFAGGGEPPLPPDGPVESVRIAYGAREDAFFGWKMHWVVPFFLLTLISGFGLRGLFRVEI